MILGELRRDRKYLYFASKMEHQESGTKEIWKPFVSPYIEVKEAGLKGRGTFTTVKIPKGTVLIQETGLLVRLRSVPGVETGSDEFWEFWKTHEILNDIRKEVEAFHGKASAEDKQWYDSLEGYPGFEQKVGIYFKNASRIPTNDGFAMIFCFQASRLNHACIPNACWRLGREGNRLFAEVGLLKDLDARDEILISYDDEVLLLEHRQSWIAAQFGFECKCSMCISHDNRNEESLRVLISEFSKLDPGISANKYGFGINEPWNYFRLAFRVFEAFQQLDWIGGQQENLLTWCGTVAGLHSDDARAAIFLDLAYKQAHLYYGETHRVTREAAFLSNHPQHIRHHGTTTIGKSSRTESSELRQLDNIDLRALFMKTNTRAEYLTIEEIQKEKNDSTVEYAATMLKAVEDEAAREIKRTKAKAKKARHHKNKQNREKAANEATGTVNADIQETIERPADTTTAPVTMDFAGNQTPAATSSQVTEAPVAPTITVADMVPSAPAVPPTPLATASPSITKRVSQALPLAVPDIRAATSSAKKQLNVEATVPQEPVRNVIEPLNYEDVGVILSYKGAFRDSFGAWDSLELKGMEERRPKPKPRQMSW